MSTVIDEELLNNANLAIREPNCDLDRIIRVLCEYKSTHDVNDLMLTFMQLSNIHVGNILINMVINEENECTSLLEESQQCIHAIQLEDIVIND